MKLGQFSAIVVVLGQFVVAEDAVVELFVDVPGADAVYENQFQASVVDACDNQTVLAMRRTDVHAATTDSVVRSQDNTQVISHANPIHEQDGHGDCQSDYACGLRLSCHAELYHIHLRIVRLGGQYRC